MSGESRTGEKGSDVSRGCKKKQLANEQNIIKNVSGTRVIIIVPASTADKPAGTLTRDAREGRRRRAGAICKRRRKEGQETPTSFGHAVR